MFSTRMVPVTSTVVFFSTTILRAEMEPEMCWSVLIFADAAAQEITGCPAV